MLELIQMDRIRKIVAKIELKYYYSLILGSFFLIIALYVFNTQGWLNALFAVLTLVFLMYGWYDVFVRNKLKFWRTSFLLVIGIVLSRGFQFVNNYLYLQIVLFTATLILYLIAFLSRLLIIRITRHGIGDSKNSRTIKQVQKEIAKEKVETEVKGLEKQIEEPEVQDW